MFQVAFNASFTLKTGGLSGPSGPADHRTKSHIAFVKRFHNQLAAKVEPPGEPSFPAIFPLPFPFPFPLPLRQSQDPSLSQKKSMVGWDRALGKKYSLKCSIPSMEVYFKIIIYGSYKYLLILYYTLNFEELKLFTLINTTFFIRFPIKRINMTAN